MIDVTWYNDKQDIILWTMLGEWTLSEYNDAVDKTSAMMTTLDYRVDVIGDLHKCHNMLPANIVHTVIARYRRIARRDSNYGISVLVGAGSKIRLIGRVINKLPYTEKRFYFANSFTEAEDIVEKHRMVA